MADEEKKSKVLDFPRREAEKSPKIEIFEEFERLMQQFDGVVAQIDSRWGAVINWMNLISNTETGENMPSAIDKGKKRGLLDMYNKKWIAFRLALDLYRLFAADTARFSSEKQQYLPRIGVLDPELAKKIEAIGVSGNGSLGILGPIKGNIGNRQLVAGYIKSNYDELMRQLDRMQDKKAADRLRKAIVLLSDRETDELNRCVNDVRSWPYKMSYGIRLFIERGFLFITGGRSRYENVSFLGFDMHFRDSELVAEMKKTPEVRKLLTYMQEMNFFAMARDAINRSVATQGNWEGFYEFYNNLKKGKNYIKMVRERFGNDEFAKLLEAFEEKKHEAPLDWEKELGHLNQQLIGGAYQLVVEPATQALIRIFEARRAKLEQEKAAAFADLQKMVAEQDSSSKARRALGDLLAKRRKQLRKEIEEERREFEDLMNEVLSVMPDFENKINQIDSIIEANNEIIRMSQILGSLSSWAKFTSNNLNALRMGDEILDDSAIKRELRATYGSSVSHRIAKNYSIMVSNLELRHKEATKLLQYLVHTGISIVIPSIEKCRKYVDSKIGGYINEVIPMLNTTYQQQNRLQLKVKPRYPDTDKSVEQAA